MFWSRNKEKINFIVLSGGLVSKRAEISFVLLLLFFSLSLSIYCLCFCEFVFVDVFCGDEGSWKVNRPI